jgi:hypothetical protein
MRTVAVYVPLAGRGLTPIEIEHVVVLEVALPKWSHVGCGAPGGHPPAQTAIDPVSFVPTTDCHGGVLASPAT